MYNDELRIKRLILDKSRRELAEAIGCNQITIARVEAGKSQNLDTIRKMAAALGYSVKIVLEPLPVGEVQP